MRIGEILKPFRRSATVDNQPNNSEFSEILEIVRCSDGIWFDRRDSKVNRYEKAASQLLAHLTLEVISDPKFYQKIDGGVHMSALQLLGRFVPSKPGEQFNQFMTNEIREEGDGISDKITVYLKGIIANKVLMTEQGMYGLKVVADGKSDEYEERLARHLYRFSGIPRHFLDIIYPEIGLTIPERPQVSMPTIVPWSDP